MERNVNFQIIKAGAIGTFFQICRFNGSTLVEVIARVTTQKLADELRARFEEIYKLGVIHGQETATAAGAQGSEAP